jgi:hypothetical protein
LCRSPGIDPAAHTTTSRGSDSALTRPITWFWFSCAPSAVAYAALTVSSIRRPVRLPAAVLVADGVAVQRRGQCLQRLAGVGYDADPPCFTESSEATLMFTKRTSGFLKAVREAEVKSL